MNTSFLLCIRLPPTSNTVLEPESVLCLVVEAVQNNLSMLLWRPTRVLSRTTVVNYCLHTNLPLVNSVDAHGGTNLTETEYLLNSIQCVIIWVTNNRLVLIPGQVGKQVDQTKILPTNVLKVDMLLYIYFSGSGEM